MPDAINHALQCFEDIAVPESNDPVALLSEDFGTLRVIGLGLSMLTAVELYDEFCRMTGEIRNVSGEWDLTANMATLGFEEAQLLPEYSFGTGGV